MLRQLNALFLILCLAITSYGVAAARGQNPDFGTEMVICTGVGMTTITLDADGNLVEKTHICPDAMSLFATGFFIADALTIPQTMQWRASLPATLIFLSPQTLTPSARGPPLVV